MANSTPQSSSSESIPKDIDTQIKTLQVGEPDSRPKYRDDGTFENVGDVRYYKPMPEYEGLHRWDPEFEWTEQEEKKLVKKVNLQPQVRAEPLELCLTVFYVD